MEDIWKSLSDAGHPGMPPDRESGQAATEFEDEVIPSQYLLHPLNAPWWPSGAGEASLLIELRFAGETERLNLYE